MIRFLVKGLVLLVVLAAALAGAAAWWIGQPLTLATETVDVSIEPGSSARDAAQAQVCAQRIKTSKHVMMPVCRPSRINTDPAWILPCGHFAIFRE